MLLAHLLHLILGAVLRRVGHGVAAIAVGQHFENDRPLAGAAMLATRFSPAAFTARTSMPSTCSPGMPKELPRRA
jgi:hypothetical protein